MEYCRYQGGPCVLSIPEFGHLFQNLWKELVSIENPERSYSNLHILVNLIEYIGTFDNIFACFLTICDFYIHEPFF
jgi:hypothetical protein